MDSLEKEPTSFVQRITKKYRLVLLSEFTFEERFSFKVSPLRIFLIVLLVSLLILAAGLVITDMIKNYITRHTAMELRHEIYELNEVVDSLEVTLNNYQYKSQATYQVLKEDHRHKEINIDSVMKIQRNSINLAALEPSEKDLELRNKVLEKEKYSITSSAIRQQEFAKAVSALIAPIKGTIIHDFKPKDSEYGTDLYTKQNQEILSIADGVVLYTAWTIDKANIVVIRHHQGLISFNEGLKNSIVEKGQAIKQGQVIGKSTHTYGCKLWLDHQFIDPSIYLNFIKLEEE